MLLRHSLDTIADMIIWLDRDARYVYVNRAATVLLGYSADEFLRMRVWDVDPLFDEAQWREHWHELERTGAVKLETVNTSRLGEPISVEVTASLVAFKGKAYNCSVVRDITAQKQAEADLRALNDRIHVLSITDALTGLANRRHLDTVLATTIRHHARTGEPFSLILLDIDAFKAFNDRYGHIEGDACLARVAAALTGAMRRSDHLVARYGGEEFACVLPNTTEAQARALAEGLRAAVAALAIPHAASPVAGVVTASFGVLTAACTEASTPLDLIRRADHLLYRAKREGRDRVVGAGC
ncbi:diguanylate cyclase [Methylobacterium terricola]|uniref:diguanylate cyclase n=2 Tax=Methylobacterium terricola TaxID=2583531 RepID=A0A5C4LI17_9HYPH|nr:diguanylate cyclase [Methylobacterium terricola]